MRPERAGDFRHRGVIESKSVSKGTTGEDEYSWIEVCECWCSISQKPRGGMFGREFHADQSTHDETYVRIRTRYRKGITADMRMKYVSNDGTRYYRFHAVTDVFERARVLEIDAVLVKGEDYTG